MTMPDYPITVRLKDGREVSLRLLQEGDQDRLHRFFVSLPETDRIFFRHDVTDLDQVHEWTANVNLSSTVPLIALDGDDVVGDATLHIEKEGWMKHIGSIRITTATTHRSGGLGTLLTRELVTIAQHLGLEKLRANVIENDVGSVKMLQAAGFEVNNVLKEMAKDRAGHVCNVVIMVNDVANLCRILEDWVQDSMIPAFRVPGHS